MSLPPEKISELKQLIHNHLSQLDVHGQIRNVLSESLRNDSGMEGNKFADEQNLLKILKDQGIVEDIMKTLKFQGTINSNPGNPLKEHIKEKEGRWMVDEEKKFPIDPAKRYLYFQVLGGKAFLEHLTDPEVVYPGNVTSYFTIYVHFMGQRYYSRPVPCACEPAFDEAFLLELKQPSSFNKQPDARNILTISEKIHIVIVRKDPTGESTLLGSYYIEWRGILCSSSGRITNAIEINGVGAESGVPIGVLDIRLDLIPRLTQITTTEVITTQLNLERTRISERERLFLVYSKQWWREYLQIRASHSNRIVKIFSQDENSVYRLACCYVKPLKSGRLLDTPRQAARFVSLLGYEKHPTVSGTRTEMWTTMHSFLARGKGDTEDHAVLLCSLLLGFGLNAYVCIGTKVKGLSHAWVVTIAANGDVMFWESLTAQRFVHNPIKPNNPPGVGQPKPQYQYRTVGCIFNHEMFYANSQPTDGIHVCSFDLDNQAHWKSMSTDAIKSVCGPGLSPKSLSIVKLTPSNVDPVLKSNDLELELRALVFDHRNDMGLTTTWDDELSYLLSPALAAYEFEHSTGVSPGNDDFQNAIRRYVPDGHTFKGFPIQFIHTNARRVFATCLRSPICEEIICCRGDQVRLAVRVRVFPYPEQTSAVWIMFSVKYKSVL